MASMMKAAESFVRGARLAVGEGAASAGTIIATASRCEHGQARARKPHAAPVAERRHQGRRHGDADADAREMQRRQAAAARCGQPVEHQGRAEDQAEGAGDAGDRAAARGTAPAMSSTAIAARQTAFSARRGQQPGAARAGQAHRRQQGAGEVADEVGRGDQARLGLAERQRLDHRRQDRGVDEAADADAGGHRQKAAEGQCEGAFVHCGRGTLGRWLH